MSSGYRWGMKLRIVFVLSCLVALACGGLDDERSAAELDALTGRVLDGDPGALAELEAFVAQHPDNDLALTILGNVYEDEDRDDEALAAYEQALAVNPERFQAITGLGILHRKRGEYDLAFAAYEQALAIDPTYAQAYASMAVIELKRENDASAVELARKGYALDSTDPGVAANLSIACHYAGDVACQQEYRAIAETLGYANLDGLDAIVSGELTVRD